jgi:hypothetical protein
MSVTCIHGIVFILGVRSRPQFLHIYSKKLAAHFIHCPDAATSPLPPTTRRRRAPKSAAEGGLEVPQGALKSDHLD